MNALLDSSVWISYLRNGAHAGVVDSLIARGRLLLHSIVLFELYAGASNLADKRDIDALAAAARRLDRIVHPQPEDFVLAGQVLAAYSRRYGRVRPRDHGPDLLIAIGAGRTSSLLLTENLTDMRRWSLALGKRARLKVRVASP